MPPRDELVEKFLQGALASESFRHRDHVRVAFGLLKDSSFPEAARLCSRGLRAMATRAGRPEAYHETITLAFLSLVAERMSARSICGFDAFAEAHPELMDKSALARWYTPARLRSDLARRTFVLPDPAIAP